MSEKFFPEEVIGSGSEKTVYPSPVDPQGEVWTTFKWDAPDLDPELRSSLESPRQTESRYYFQKLLHLLRPASFPDAISFFPVSPRSLRLERREVDPEHIEMNKLFAEMTAEHQKTGK